MKRRHMICALVLAACLLPLTGCSKNPLYARYDYDLSEYIDVGEYKGLPAEWADSPVTDEDVQREVQAALWYYGTFVEVDRAAALGDTVAFSCTVTLNGEELADYNEDKGELQIGFDTYGEAIDEALVGSQAGDTVEAERVFPEDETYGDVAGQTVQYTISVNGIYERKIPEYNDNYVKGYMGYNSVAEYEAVIRAALEESAAATKMSTIISQIWTVAVENAKVLQYPEKEVAEIRDMLTEDLRNYTQKIGINFDEYIKAMYGQTEEEFLGSVTETAQAQVKEEMFIYAVARAEKITITDEIYHDYLHYCMEAYDMESHEEVEKYFTKEVLMQGILGDMVREAVAGYATIVAPDEWVEE